MAQQPEEEFAFLVGMYFKHKTCSSLSLADADRIHCTLLEMSKAGIDAEDALLSSLAGRGSKSNP